MSEEITVRRLDYLHATSPHNKNQKPIILSKIMQKLWCQKIMWQMWGTSTSPLE